MFAIDYIRLMFSCLFARFLIGQYVTIHGDVISHVNISHVMVEDGGEYSCVASNRAGKVSHSARLNVYGKFYYILYSSINKIKMNFMTRN